LKLAIALVSLLALGAGACGELPDPTTVQDLRVLGVKCEPGGFLVNLDDPGSATEAELTATLTALVVDPIGGGQEMTVMGVGCPDYIDAITSATNQGSKLCPPASTTSMIPEPIGSKLATVPAMGPSPVGPVVPDGIEYNPTLTFGLRPDQIAAFFSPTPTGIQLLDDSVALNRDFGLAAIVNLTFELAGERAEAIKRVVYWPRLDPAQQPNKNPTMGGIRLYRHRDEASGNPIDEIDPATDPMPTVSVSAMDKLYVQPAYGPEIAESYLLKVRNAETMQIETKLVDRELIRFYFYASPFGTFDPELQFSEENPITMVFHDDSEYVLPKPADVPPEGRVVTLWIVAHDERAGTDWVSRTIRVVP
jgi:hypothetical protein